MENDIKHAVHSVGKFHVMDYVRTFHVYCTIELHDDVIK